MNVTPPFSSHSSNVREQHPERMPRDEDQSLIVYLKRELEATLARNEALEKENQELRQEGVRLKAQIGLLKAHDNERKSMLWKKLQNSNDNLKNDLSQQKASDFVKVLENTASNVNSKVEKLPNPPPKPVPASIPLPKGVTSNKLPPKTAPPPPPLPSKTLIGLKSVRRVPELVEFYRMLTRKDVQMENRSNGHAVPVAVFSTTMIGEIESRSTYLSAIKSDVENRKGFINSLCKEVESAAFTDISNVEAFVKWLDKELAPLVDERAVLKHFPQWPEQKADTLREAASNYRNLSNLESEVSLFEDNQKEPLTQALGRIQTMQDRLERNVNNIERTRESTIKKYRDFQIPWEWLLNTGLIGQIKLGSLKLAREFMRRITRELQQNECSNEDNILLQAAKFAYRVHQFAGGFDTETTNAFYELKKVGIGTDKE